LVAAAAGAVVGAAGTAVGAAGAVVGAAGAQALNMTTNANKVRTTSIVRFILLLLSEKSIFVD
jgi:hypothetical protein